MAKYKITKTPKGLYTTVVYLGTDSTGKRIQKRITGATSTVVRMEADQLRSERHEKKYSSMTFKEAADQFKERKQPMVSPTTYRDYESFLRNLEEKAPSFLLLRISEIDRDTVQDLLGLLRKKLSPKSVRNYWGFVNSVLKSQDVTLTGITLPEKVVPDIYVPDDTTMKQVLKLSQGTVLEIPIMLAAFGPMREGEICALEMRDIKGNVVHVHRDIAYLKNGWQIKETPKTAASNRYIEYPAAVIDKIREQGYVTELTAAALGTRFYRFLKEHGLPHFRFHDLRHYAASTLHAQGVPDAYIMKRGGWTTDQTLKAVYRHTLADQDKVMTEKANTFFEGMLQI